MGELEIFAIRIKQLRESLNMTQTEFSGYIGIKQQTLSGYERGLMKPPLDIAKNIAEKCNVSIDWLCGLSEKMNNNDELITYSDVISCLFKIEAKIKITCDSTRIMVYNKKLKKFLGDWKGMINLRANKTIDDNLYNLWVQQQLDLYNFEIMSREGLENDPSQD